MRRVEPAVICNFERVRERRTTAGIRVFRHMAATPATDEMNVDGSGQC